MLDEEVWFDTSCLFWLIVGLGSNADAAPGKVYYTLDGSEPDESSEVYSRPIELNVVGNQTILAVAMGAHVMSSDVMASPYYAIIPDPDCLKNEYEPHTGHGLAAQDFDIFDRNCKVGILKRLLPHTAISCGKCRKILRH